MKPHFLTKQLMAMTAFTLAVANAHAQAYEINWFTIDGGGGASTGGSFALNGTIGQPDAGAMNGGTFALSGGFWSGLGPEPLPRLAIRRAGTEVILSWPNPSTGYQLQQTTAAGWSDVLRTPAVSGGDKEVTLLIDAPYRLFRLQKP